jgi:hypothetical protein
MSGEFLLILEHLGTRDYRARVARTPTVGSAMGECTDLGPNSTAVDGGWGARENFYWSRSASRSGACRILNVYIPPGRAPRTPRSTIHRGLVGGPRSRGRPRDPRAERRGGPGGPGEGEEALRGPAGESRGPRKGEVSSRARPRICARGLAPCTRCTRCTNSPIFDSSYTCAPGLRYW